MIYWINMQLQFFSMYGQKSSVHYKISQLSMEEQMFLFSSHNPCIEIIIYACKFYDSAALENGCHTLLELDRLKLPYKLVAYHYQQL